MFCLFKVKLNWLIDYIYSAYVKNHWKEVAVTGELTPVTGEVALITGVTCRVTGAVAPITGVTCPVTK